MACYSTCERTETQSFVLPRAKGVREEDDWYTTTTKHSWWTSHRRKPIDFDPLQRERAIEARRFEIAADKTRRDHHLRIDRASAVQIESYSLQKGHDSSSEAEGASKRKEFPWFLPVWDRKGSFPHAKVSDHSFIPFLFCVIVGFAWSAWILT